MKEVTVHVLRQLDVGDAIELELVSAILQGREATRGATRLRGPEPSPTSGVVLAEKPVDLKFGQMNVGPFSTQVRVRLFDFGVAAIRFTFTTAEVTGPTLVELATAIAAEASRFDAQARKLWGELSGSIRPALHVSEEAPSEMLMEDFTVWLLPELPRTASQPAAGGRGSTEELFAQLVLGEPAGRRLAASTIQEIARRAIRYFEDDLVLVDYDNALIVDRSGAADLPPARRAGVLTLELGEITDRLELASTLVGDTYTVQIYREAALRFRLSEAGSAVREKISMVARVADMLATQVQARRDFVLELLIFVLIAVELVVAIR